VAGRIFEAFVTTKPEGVGLGLAAARQTADDLGGTLTWDRDAGLEHRAGLAADQRQRRMPDASVEHRRLRSSCRVGRTNEVSEAHHWL
jgi:C4-dicarboxylate-specific signal transduction histidine kinase